MLDFRPPLDNPILIKLVKLLLPLYMKGKLHDTQINPVEGAIERFRQVKGKRTLICPNHSNRHDPQVMFAFSSLVGEDFNFIAAREIFDWDHGLNGWWLQHLGCYSIVRGAVDRESFRTTKRILVENKKKLVLFPEGEISRQNDTLMTLESGAAQLTFWALEELDKAHQNEANRTQPNVVSGQTVFILPMAIKYTYSQDIRPQLNRTLTRLEQKLGISVHKAGVNHSLYKRLRNVSEILLADLEEEYGQEPNAEAFLNDRVEALKSLILTRIGSYLKVDLPQPIRHLDSVRLLRNAIDDFIYADEEQLSDYQRKMHEEKAAIIRGFYKDLDRVVNFISIYDGYLKDNATQERFVDVLDRLETEILGGEPSLKGARIVFIDVGDPIDTRQYFANYKRNKRATINEISESLSNQISAMLVKLDNYREPIYI